MSKALKKLHLVCISYSVFFFKNFYFLIEREKERMKVKEDRKRETLIRCSTYLWVQWLILVCVLTKDRTFNLGIWEWHSNQLSYMDRTLLSILTNKIWRRSWNHVRKGQIYKEINLVSLYNKQPKPKISTYINKNCSNRILFKK